MSSRCVMWPGDQQALSNHNSIQRQSLHPRSASPTTCGFEDQRVHCAIPVVTPQGVCDPCKLQGQHLLQINCILPGSTGLTYTSLNVHDEANHHHWWCLSSPPVCLSIHPLIICLSILPSLPGLLIAMWGLLNSHYRLYLCI